MYIENISGLGITYVITGSSLKASPSILATVFESSFVAFKTFRSIFSVRTFDILKMFSSKRNWTILNWKECEISLYDRFLDVDITNFELTSIRKIYSAFTTLICSDRIGDISGFRRMKKLRYVWNISGFKMDRKPVVRNNH